MYRFCGVVVLDLANVRTKCMHPGAWIDDVMLSKIDGRRIKTDAQNGLHLHAAYACV